MDKVLINGCLSVFGKETVKAFLNKGYRVFGVDIKSEDNDDFNGGKYNYFKTDVTQVDSVRQLFKQFNSNEAFPDVIVNCSQFMYVTSCYNKFSDTTFRPAFFEKIQMTNVIGPYNLAFEASQAYIKLQRNSPLAIVNTSSFGEHGSAGHSALASTAAAMNSLTSALASFTSDTQIRFITISPGLFENEFMKDAPEDISRTFGYLNSFPYRLGNPAEYSQIVTDSALNGALNGTIIPIDGGMRLCP